MNTLTLKQFTDICRAKEQFPEMIRAGQAMAIVLNRTNRELYKEIVGTPLDPFYDDGKIEAFLSYLAESTKWKSVRD